MDQIKYNQEELRDKIKKFGWWYQNFDLDGVLTNPTNPEYPESRWKLLEPYIPKDLTGKTVLDLGCNAGYFAVKMKQRGAASVLGVDVVPEAIDQARFISDYYDLQIDYKIMNVYEFVLRNKQKFDIVLFLGLFYHLRYPLLVLDKVAEISKEKMYLTTVVRGTPPITNDDPGLLWEQRKLALKADYDIAETNIFDHPDYPKMFFIEEKYNHDYSNWWLPNETCVYAMLRSAGFRNIMKTGNDSFICDSPSPEYASSIEKIEGFSYPASRIPPMDKWL